CSRNTSARDDCSGKQTKKTRFHEHSSLVRGVAVEEYVSSRNSGYGKAATPPSFKPLSDVFCCPNPA
ncbi:hypothetical protein, partial [Microvirga sp. G4-2]|uniref:hypothetical protein n=1 Tax=Microvirga sp. G4-2 TaxID=3434467 RepID=UPI004045067C